MRHPVLIRLHDPVSDTDLCKNILRLRRILLDLSPDIRHIHTQDPVIIFMFGPQISLII